MNTNKKAYLKIKGEIYERFRHDDEEHKCGDCGVVAGEYHHIYCDMERCPKCRSQLISCDCEDIYLEDVSS